MLYENGQDLLDTLYVYEVLNIISQTPYKGFCVLYKISMDYLIHTMKPFDK